MQPQASPMSVASSRSMTDKFELPNLLPATGSSSSLLDAVVGPAQAHAQPDPASGHPAPSLRHAPGISAPVQRYSHSPLAQAHSQAGSVYSSDAESPFLLAGGAGGSGGGDVGRSGSMGSWSVLSDGESRANSSALPPAQGDASHLAQGRSGLPGGGGKAQVAVAEPSKEERERVEEIERVLAKRWVWPAEQTEVGRLTLEQQVEYSAARVRVSGTRGQDQGGRR